MPWTPEQARANLAKSHQAHREKRQKMREREQLLDRLIKDAAERLATTTANAATGSDDQYATSQVVICKEHIARLWKLMGEATEPGDCDKYACAIARLSEVRRVLAGEPLPGSRRPGADKPARQVNSLPDE